MSSQPITISGQHAIVTFQSFCLDDYGTFLRLKKTVPGPEMDLKYDWRRDTYTVRIPAKYAKQLDPAAEPEAAIEAPELAGYLFDYQKFIVQRALESKRFAIFADCGLGKTPMALEFARQVINRTFEKYTNTKVLIFTHPQIIGEFEEQADRFYDMPALHVHPFQKRDDLIAWLRGDDEWQHIQIGITNYEKMIPGQIPELRNLAGLILDESSILKTGGGTIKWNLVHSAKGIEYKLSCTATPAPNEAMEYASQASFLEKLRSEGEIIWTYFRKNDDGTWRIIPHALPEFYRFMSSWSIFLRNPASYGFKDNIKPVPAPEFIVHEIAATPEQMAEAQQYRFQIGAGLLGEQRMGVKERLKLSQIAKGFIYGDKPHLIRSAKPQRVAELALDEVLRGNQTLIWTTFDEEAALISQTLGDTPHRVLDGGTPPDIRAKIISMFQDGSLPILISKPRLLGFGMNFQSGSAMIFSGWTDSFEQQYQAVRRMVRYGQTKNVRIHIPIVRELEGSQWENLQRKQAAFEEQAALQEKYYLEAMGGKVLA